MSDLELAWNALLVEGRSEPGWHGRRVFADAPCRIQAAIRPASGVRGVLFEVPIAAVPAVVEYPACAGFALLPELLTGGPGGTVRLVLEERAPAYAELFSAMAADVTHRTADARSASAAVACLLARLAVWQRFASRFGPGRLTDEACVGLAAELIFLDRYALARLRPEAAAQAWVGPTGAPQDFRFPAGLVEIKGSLAQTPASIRISNLQQMDGTAGLPLFLCHLALSAAVGAGARSLPDLVADLRQAFGAGADGALEAFEDLLMDVGYLDIHAAHYLQPFYAVRAATFYRVEGMFPRLTPGEVPSGVLSATYAISLAACAAWVVPEAQCLSVIETVHV